jgi:hypothetical protein
MQPEEGIAGKNGFLQGFFAPYKLATKRILRIHKNPLLGEMSNLAEQDKNGLIRQ